MIRYQGQATDAQGIPLEGAYTLTLALYATPTGGTALWTETHPSTTLTGGHFSILLGNGYPPASLEGVDWTQPLWLGVTIGSEPELTPRQQITSVPTALRAEVAEQLSVPVTTSTITDDAHSLVPSSAVILWPGSACPEGYTRFSAMDGKFLVADSTYNASAGGSNTKDLTHTHAGPAHTHSVPRDGWGRTDSGGPDGRLQVSRADSGGYSNIVATGDHATGVGGTGSTSTPTPGLSSVDIRPAFATVLLCQKD